MPDLYNADPAWPRKHIIDHADNTVPARQHELQIIQTWNISAVNYVDHGSGDPWSVRFAKLRESGVYLLLANKSTT